MYFMLFGAGCQALRRREPEPCPRDSSAICGHHRIEGAVLPAAGMSDAHLRYAKAVRLGGGNDAASLALSPRRAGTLVSDDKSRNRSVLRYIQFAAGLLLLAQG